MSAPSVATAPVSFGIFAGVNGGLAPAQIVDAIVAAGYTATELGPPGMLGTPSETGALLRSSGLDAVGAYVPFTFATEDEAQFEAEFASFQITLAELAHCATTGALAILADEGDDQLRHLPRRSVGDVWWNDVEWARASRRIARCAETASSAGLAVSFHPHLATGIQTPAEINRLLAETDVALTVDSGHFLMGGWDPAQAVSALAPRINHLHIKDVFLAGVPEDAVAATMDIDDWWPAIGAQLGTGDVDLDAFVDAVQPLDTRWIVIEQDRHPVVIAELAAVIETEQKNRLWLERRLHGQKSNDK